MFLIVKDTEIYRVEAHSGIVEVTEMGGEKNYFTDGNSLVEWIEGGSRDISRETSPKGNNRQEACLVDVLEGTH